MEDRVSEEVAARRKAAYPIHPLILNRWSPRAMSGDELTDEELFPLFEAARWAPSSYNNQPWRIIIARTPADRERFLEFLAPGNRTWCIRAAVLVVVISRNTFEYNSKPARTHSFDTGAAWENLALEGSRRGLVVHGMQGFDYEKAKQVLGVPDDYTVEAMIAIGKLGDKSLLPEKLQQVEVPSDRKPLAEIVFEGCFGSKLADTKS